MPTILLVPSTPNASREQDVRVGRTQRATRTRRVVPSLDRAGVDALGVRHAGHSPHAWPSSGRAGHGAGTRLTDIATTVAPPRRVSWMARRARLGPRPWPTWVASLGAPVPLLAQELLELVHQLRRVKGVLMPWARHFVRRRVIVLL
jgi:hypothetical protein